MLEKLFVSRNRIKVMEFFFVRNGSGRLREISKILNAPASFLSKELNSLREIGLLKKEKEIYKANESCNILEDLRNILVKTDSLVYPLSDALNSKKIKFAFVFGSYARGSYNNESDVDLMVIGSVPLEEVMKAVEPAEKKVKRTINPVVWTKKEFIQSRGGSFVRDILSKEIIMIKGDENELRELAK